MAAEPPLTVMVSSSVYQNKSLLDQVFAVLQGHKYEVWMSHMGTVPVFSRQSNFDNCLEAVERCDIFLGIITPFYGTGKTEDGKTITHHELLKAIEIDKVRWVLSDYRVNFARQLLKQYRFTRNGTPRAAFQLRKTSVLDDIGVIEMYEDAIRNDVSLPDRTGNWVHEYRTDDGAVFYIDSQLGAVDRVREFISRTEEEGND